MSPYLQQIDAAADADKFKLVRKFIDESPLPFFKALREERPVLVTPVATLVTRLNDCIDILNQPSVYTVKLYDPKMTNFLMSHDDDAFHTREKSIMQGFLNRNDLPQVRDMVTRIARDLLAEANGRIDAINGYTRRVPATLVRDYFGLTGEDLSALIEWSYWNQADTFYNQPFDEHTPEQRAHIVAEHDRTSKALGKYIIELMARRLLAVKLEQAKDRFLWLWYALQKLLRWLMGKKTEALTDDILTRMLRSHFDSAVEFDLQRVAINAGGLLIGAIETTSQAVAQSVQFLLNRPELLTRARQAAAHADPRDFDDIVFETLRFVPISPFLFRQTSQEVVIGQGTDYATRLAPFTNVLVATQSAMFDPQAYDRAEEFIPGRNWYHQYHFGYGAHECLGRYVGAVMIPEMVRQLLLLSELTQESPIDYEGGHLPQTYPLRWNAAT